MEECDIDLMKTIPDYNFEMEQELDKYSKNFNEFTIKLFCGEGMIWESYFEELPNISSFGATPVQALSELSLKWNSLKEIYDKHIKPRRSVGEDK